MATVNYAKEYAKALALAYPNVLHFHELRTTENNGKYRFVNAKTIEIPVVKTKGRKNGNRDTIETIKRNHDNNWETKTLSNHRTWSTLVHPKDVIETNMVMSIQNATRVFNEQHKFPEMDCYLISKLHELKVARSETADITNTVLTAENVLSEIDKLMDQMDENNVPQTGRILYVTPAVNTLIKNAKDIQKVRDVGDGNQAITRNVNRLDELTIRKVPSKLMKTVYNFDDGCTVGHSAKQINFMLVHPSCVLAVESYEFSQMEGPTALSQGKAVYYEESFEDVFILNEKSHALAFNVEA